MKRWPLPNGELLRRVAGDMLNMFCENKYERVLLCVRLCMHFMFGSAHESFVPTLFPIDIGLGVCMCVCASACVVCVCMCTQHSLVRLFFVEFFFLFTFSALSSLDP